VLAGPEISGGLQAQLAVAHAADDRIGVDARVAAGWDREAAFWRALGKLPLPRDSSSV
jgi:hypothetical protein